MTGISGKAVTAREQKVQDWVPQEEGYKENLAHCNP